MCFVTRIPLSGVRSGRGGSPFGGDVGGEAGQGFMGQGETDLLALAGGGQRAAVTADVGPAGALQVDLVIKAVVALLRGRVAAQDRLVALGVNLDNLQGFEQAAG